MSKWSRYWKRKRLHKNATDDKTKEVLMKIYDFVMNDTKVVNDEFGNIRNKEHDQTSS